MIRKSKRQDGSVAVPPDEPGPRLPEDGPNRAERALEQQVREAAEGRRFHIHYQPLFSVPDDSIVGVEALLRWDAGAGRISPARFVPVLESTGLIGTIGEWVLAEACREVAGWPKPASPGFLTVNVSAHQIIPGFADVVVGTLAVAGFPTDRLCIELTNPATIAEPAVAWAELRRLKGCEVRLFIDDFGTAGASIVDLKRFVVDAVKIDGSFIQGLGQNQDDDAIVGALIGLAHALGMQAIAEGVETADQLEHLRALGCDLAQGFHFGAPGSGAVVQGLFSPS